MLKITAIILTHNEAANMAPCLNALARVDDLVIVDSGSTDGTIEAARAVRPDVRIFEHPFLDFGDQRNWAIDHTEPKHDWLLFVDADEYCDPELLDEIAALSADPGKVVGGYIAGRNYFLGRWLKYSTMYPSYQLRLLQRGQVRYRKEGHGQREVTDGPLRYLKNGWRHESFSKGLTQWIERHNRYSSDEAITLESPSVASPRGNALRRRVARAVMDTPLVPLARFAYSYIWCRGFLDGYPGLIYSMLISGHHINILAKRLELRSIAENARSEPGSGTR